MIKVNRISMLISTKAFKIVRNYRKAFVFFCVNAFNQPLNVVYFRKVYFPTESVNNKH